MVMERARLGMFAFLSDRHIVTLHEAHIERHSLESAKLGGIVLLLSGLDHSQRLRRLLDGPVAAAPGRDDAAGPTLPLPTRFALLVAVEGGAAAHELLTAVALQARAARVLERQAAQHTLTLPKSVYLI